jgi:hypothetical protein
MTAGAAFAAAADPPVPGAGTVIAVVAFHRIQRQPTMLRQNRGPSGQARIEADDQRACPDG